MPAIEAIAPDPIKMCFFEPPAEAQGSREIYQRGVATAREGIVINGIPQAPKDKRITVQTAKEHSFGFGEVYARKAGTSIVVASLSTWLAGFDGTNPQLQRECGEALLKGIAGPNVEIKRYGEHKSVAFLRTRRDSSTLVRRFLDTQDDLIPRYFPKYAEAQHDLTKIRYARLVEMTPFDDILEGEVSALKKPYEDDSENPDSNNNYYFAWGYQQEENELFAISPDNIKYSMRMLIATSLTTETAMLLQDINDFMLGDDDEDRIVVQIDWDKDATCSNTAINAQNISIFDSTLNLNSWEADTEDIFSTGIPSITHIFGYLNHLKNETNKSSDFCQVHQKNKNECNCTKKES